MASEVSIFPAFSVSVLTPKLGNPGRQGKMEDTQREICKHRREMGGGGGDWSVVLTVVTDVEFSTKLCQKPLCQG